MYYTTINKIFNVTNIKNAQKLLEKFHYIDDQISFKQIYDAVGLQDALWCIRALDYDDEIQQFALRCARRVEHLDETGEAKKCNDTLEKYLKGEATKEELEYGMYNAECLFVVNNKNLSAKASSSSASAAMSANIYWDKISSGCVMIASAAKAAMAANANILKQIEDDFLITFCRE